VWTAALRFELRWIGLAGGLAPALSAADDTIAH
jgi:hypothetical protein